MSAVTDTLIITQRQLRLLTRVPEVLIFSTIQPVMFVLLFRYVFGGSIDTGQPGGYVQLLMPGIFVQTVAFTLAGTASGLAEDMKKGLIDRFRSLPISQSALVIGRTLGDSLLNIVVLAVMGIAGYLVGWRPSSGALNVAVGFLFLLFFGYALSWVGIYVGLSASDARVVQNVSFLVTFPLTFLSNAFAPTTGMPRALQYFAEWNPVSTMVAACRELFGLENQFGATAGSFPSENPLLTSFIYMIIIMAIFIPISVRKYKRAAD
ncbi:ABC-2 type transport system permease protein [Candidatus Planktophila lacus]|jgi:ABC transporter DrrB family efflux protein|uniref:ABC transporter permease n=1 Tax=Candidatus Planktophila lacus TaxID=1884913 RepID=UPI000BACC073|nr:ABC transporter permease [Candidatus Planktophila lacus]ASY24610.1 ABC-2 type transport system permease protein [Candidatus Planktophila lacus]ASY28555.1 ABC-2 type transport system permease protein [Candidatus Planktophila lacus]